MVRGVVAGVPERFRERFLGLFVSEKVESWARGGSEKGFGGSGLVSEKVELWLPWIGKV